MAFASGSITLKRFYVPGQQLTRADEELLEALSNHSMGKDTIQSSDHTEIGWVTGEHLFDTEFGFEKNVIADGLHFAMRIDTNKPPADLIRSYQKMNEQAILEATGREFLSKAQRREAREQALSRADSEARSGTFRRMKQVPVFWDLTRQEVYFAGTSPTMVDQFMLLFSQTFDRTITPLGSGELAARWASLAGEERMYEDCQPAMFVKPPDGFDPQDVTTTQLDEGRTKDFLGTEWLTWLWYAAHVESPTISTANAGSVTVLFEKSVQLQCAFQMTGSATMQSENPTRLPESAVALAGGKRPVRAGLQLETHGNAYSFVLRGDVVHVTSLQLPPPEEANSARMVFEDRIEKLRDLIKAVDGTYTAFLKRRLSKKWPQTLAAIRSWVASGQAANANTSQTAEAFLEAAS